MQQATILNLKWDTFSSQLTNCLDLCYENEYFVDLSLVCKNGETLKCHKMVLCNASSFFRRLLVKNEHPHPMIILHDIEADDLKTIVNFMYCGEVQVTKSEARRILKIAETLEVSGLKDILKYEGSAILLPEADESDESRGKSSETECPLKTTEPKSPTKNKMAADISNCIESSFQKMAPNGKRNTSNGKSRYNFRNKKVNVTYKEDNVGTCDSLQKIAASDNTPNVVDGSEKSAKKRTNAEERLSWKDVLDEISEEGQSSLKRLCLMNEIEITATPPKSPKVSELGANNGRAASCSSMSQLSTNCMVYIKDELDIPCDWEFKSDRAGNENHDCGEHNAQTVNLAIETLKKTPRIIETVSVSPKSVMKLVKRKSTSG